MRVVYEGSPTGTTRVSGQDLQREPKGSQPLENQRARPDRNVRPVTRINGERIYFRQLAVMAFPKKTDANLAFFAKVDARTARRWLADDNEPPSEVLGIVLAEIMRRYGRRD